MILTGNKILKEARKNKIRIDPIDSLRVTTNSYDLALGENIIQYTSKILDPKKKASYKKIVIPKDGFLMKAGSFILAETAERIGSNFYVPIIHGKSGTARLGLFVHITADLIDIGSFGKSTLQLYSTLPVRLYPGMLIAQVSFWKPKGKIILYNGKYQHSDGPRPSLTYKDFK